MTYNILGTKIELEAEAFESLIATMQYLKNCEYATAIDAICGPVEAITITDEQLARQWLKAHHAGSFAPKTPSFPADMGTLQTLQNEFDQKHKTAIQ